MTPRTKPLLIYDGDCGFCLGWVNRWRPLMREQVEYAPFQGAEAAFRVLACAPAYRWPLWLYRNVPGVAPLTEWGYRFVARHRSGLSGTTQCQAKS